MKVLAVGGAGYVGSHCVKALVEHGADVLVYDNLSTGHRSAVAGVPLVVGDMSDERLMEGTMRDFRPDAVMHFAGLTSPAASLKRPLAYYQNNVGGTARLLEAMRFCGVRRLVFSSSCAVYGNPPTGYVDELTPVNPVSPYGVTKAMVERILGDCCRAWQLGFVSLRYFNAAGAALDGSLGEQHAPEVHLIPVALQAVLDGDGYVMVHGRDYDTPDGTCVRDYVHVDDLARAHWLAMESLERGDRRAYNLGTGIGLSVMTVLGVVTRVTGGSLKMRIGERRPGDPAMLYANATAARDELGWTPEVMDLEDIVRSAWNWHKAQYGR